MSKADESENWEIIEIIKECVNCRYLWMPGLLLIYMCLLLWLMVAVHPIVGFGLTAALIAFLANERKKSVEKMSKEIHGVSDNSGFKWNVESSLDDYEQLLEKEVED
jgi:hypothetical protein